MTKKSTTKKSLKKKQPQARTKVKVTQAPGFSVWQLALLCVLSLAAAYLFASLAIDSGSLWHYILCFAAVYLAVKFAIQSIRTFSKERST